jgi:hypothetical protein
MRADVSVIMPAYQASATIGRAAQSVFAQGGVKLELVLCADDGQDYAALLRGMLPSAGALTLCRTPAPKCGPAIARNIALSHASADFIACLDADDCFGAERLRMLLPAAERYGVATGPTCEIEQNTGAVRIARPRLRGDRLDIADICELRMPFPPLFHRRLAAEWPQVAFAEDVILNVDLFCAAGVYPFIEGANYLYSFGPGTRSHSPEALQHARTGYLEILALIETRTWPQPVRDLVRRVFSEDLARVEGARAADAGGGSWRDIVRNPAGAPAACPEPARQAEQAALRAKPT